MLCFITAPIKGYMNPLIYYQFKIKEMSETFGNSYFGTKSSYVDSDRILSSSNCPSYFLNNPFANKNSIFLNNPFTNTNIFFNNKSLDILSGKHSNYQIYLSMHLPVLPNSEASGETNFSNTKIYLSKLEYNLLEKHVEYFDQQMGASHPGLSSIDFKIMKVCTITIITQSIVTFKAGWLL